MQQARVDKGIGRAHIVIMRGRWRLWYSHATMLAMVIRDDGWGGSDGYYVTYKPVTLPCISFLFIENKIYSLSFSCDVCNEVDEHMQ